MRPFVWTLVFAVALTLGVLIRAPYQLRHPNDPSLVIGTIYAPVWNPPRNSYSRVVLDKSRLGLELGTIWVLVSCGLVMLRSEKK